MRGVVPVTGRSDIRGSVRKMRKESKTSIENTSVSEYNTPHKQNTTNSHLSLGRLNPMTLTLPQDNLLFAMATCHSLTIINKELVGDPLELKMFESTGWLLEEPSIDDTHKYDLMMPTFVRPPVPDVVSSSENLESTVPLQVGILRQFPFESSLQRMSVITRKLGNSHWDLYCKGSPEKVASLSTPESVPANFTSELRTYTDQGYRVLALSHRPLTMPYHKVQKVDREEVECNLQFLGLLVMENRLKEETTGVISQLRQANIKIVMVTGDNLLTALSVARECGLVSSDENVMELKVNDENQSLAFEPTTPPKELSNTIDSAGDVKLSIDQPKTVLAVDGKSWEAIQDLTDVTSLNRILCSGAVFARMKPDQKQQLITQLQSLGYYVGMCGDGANDCGALKAAHAGISLSEAEASVASPFTSKDPNVSCVPTLIREGRTALVTSFGVFKYMAAYSLTQFVSIMILYSIESNLTDFQFLYIDLFLITVFAIFFGRTESYKKNLHPTPPPASLISITPIASLLLHMFLVVGFQTFCFFYVQTQPWYVPFNATTSEDILAGHENYAVYSVSQFQYIILAVVFSRGPPYRQRIFSNYLLCGSLVIMTVVSVYLTLWPAQWCIDLFESVMPPEGDPDATFFRYQIIIFAVINCLLAIIIENFIVEYLIYQKLRPMIHNIQKSKRKYIDIIRKLENDKAWPPQVLGHASTLNDNRNGTTDKKTHHTVVQYQSAL